jgi:glycosyltransferase involved in cell wall biosynthesis
MKQTITAVIPALNEEKNIQRCIESVLWCDKVRVLWMGEDKTGDIAKNLGAEVVKTDKLSESNFLAVQKNINLAIDNSTTDWMLRIDADEVVTPELKEEILHILQSETENKTEIVAFGIPRKQYFWGGFLKGGDWSYDRLVRLFKPGFARYENYVQVHEQFVVHGKIANLKQALLHYSHPSLAVAKKKFQIYTDLEMKQLHDPISTALFKLIFLPPYIFLRWMIWHHGYKDGLRGAVAGAFRAWYDFLLYSKYIKHRYF